MQETTCCFRPPDDCDCRREGEIGNCELCGAPIDYPDEIGDRLFDDPDLMWCKGDCTAQAARDLDEWERREAAARLANV